MSAVNEIQDLLLSGSGIEEIAPSTIGQTDIFDRYHEGQVLGCHRVPLSIRIPGVDDMVSDLAW